MTGSDMGNGTVWVAVTPEQAAAAAARYWWVVLIGGLLSLAFGVWMVFKPVNAAHTIAVVLGLWLVLVGLVDLVNAGGAQHRTPALVAGVVLVVLGLVLVFKPGIPVKVIAIFWGLAILLGGIIRIVAAMTDRTYGWGWRMLLGAINAALGLLIVVWPTATVGVVFVIAGISAILTGLVWIAASSSLRQAPERLAALGRGTP